MLAKIVEFWITVYTPYYASRRWQNVPSMTDSFTRPRKQFDVHKDTVHNLIEHHESLTIKYRELELNEKTCRQGY
ncbi:hypothetical protein DPMN_067401 [Dreissena polymorpha]|uniref:Uncharacterized protein n=1 Tax=Dreissena polymorpha TaxID=45954 RepID=A0A9D3YZL2_DREPO|nr:hypothetical protein DPMN_067401 [Dreissena polymorpha]